MDHTSQQATLTSPFRSMSWWACVLLAALLPALVIYTLLLVFLQVDPRHFIPSSSDEIFNWLQVRTLLTAGFNGGYFALAEQAAPAAFTHFYNYGPWFVLLYGIPGRIFGWELYSFGPANLLYVALGIIGCCLIARPQRKQVLLLGVAIALFWPGMLYHYSAFQEGFQQALAFLLGASFYVGIRHRSNLPRYASIAVLILILVAALLRMSWIVLALPWLLLVLPPTLAGRASALGITLFLVIFTIVIWEWAGASSNNVVLEQVNRVTASPFSAIEGLLKRFGDNIGYYFDRNKAADDLVFSIQTIGFIVGAALASRFTKGDARLEAVFHVYNIAVIFLAAMVLYYVGTRGDFRLLAAHVALSLVLLILNRRWRWVGLLVVLNLLGSVAFWNTFDRFYRPRMVPEQPSFIRFQEAVAPYLPYDPNQTNGWCNTMAFSINDFRPYLNYVPEGIGLTFFMPVHLPGMTFRSRYWLLKAEDLAEVQAQPHAPPLIFLTTTEHGDLYLNLNADCS